jgi:pyruvate/2-oxoglutarate/acetoin dehydrogenase E1 component
MHNVELFDVQTLVPFDNERRIIESIRKTNRILFVDEDVPGGTNSLHATGSAREAGRVELPGQSAKDTHRKGTPSGLYNRW